MFRVARAVSVFTALMLINATTKPVFGERFMLIAIGANRQCRTLFEAQALLQSGPAGRVPIVGRYACATHVLGFLASILVFISGPFPVLSAEHTALADFKERCAAPGVVKCIGFDTLASVEPYLKKSGAAEPVVDANVKASGAGSLLFIIPSNSPANTSGSYFRNFSDDLQVQFGEEEEFFIQWRQRFSRELLAARYKGGGGWKQVIIGEGDRPGKWVSSCTQLEIVVQNTLHRGFPQMYHSCGAKDGKYQGFKRRLGKYDFDLQYPNGCMYSHFKKTERPSSSCVGYVADQWMTFQVRIKIGTWYRNDKKYRRDSEIELWVAQEGRPSRQAIIQSSYDIANNNPQARYGKIWLLPYNSRKRKSESHPTAYTWYDELIISRSKIRDSR